MTEERVQRRLAAILAADVVAYSRLMEMDEAGTLAALREHRREILDPLVAQHQGRMVKLMGDGVLVEFASAVIADDRRILLRVGVNLGDVVVEGGDLYGDGVIIAVRLQTMAEPGGICLAGSVHHQVENKLPLAFEDLGPCEVKNMAKPVHALRVIMGGEADRTTPHQGAPPKPSIAVLPFTNMSGDPAQQYFSDGITEDIITELARFRQLHVLARNSSFRYREQDVDMMRVGRELGVAYLVEGSVRRLGDRIRITAQLIDAGSGHHLWAERFDRNQEDLFDVQDQVVRTIVGTLVGRLQAAGVERAKRKPPASLAAYECVLRADALPDEGPDAAAEARRLYEKAIELDPEYGRAHALLAYIVHLEWLRDMSASDRLLDRAFELAKEAVALDENDATCQALLGLIHLSRQSHDLAEHHYHKALELNRNGAALTAAVGSFYGYLGKPEEGMGYFKEAKVLDPYFDPSWYWPSLGIVHFIARRYDDAIAALSRSSNTPFWAYPYLAACYALTGRIDRAKACAAEVIRLLPDFSLSRFTAKESFKHATDRQHLLDGLRKAGLPE
jgi:adenylate cyclase